MIYNYYYINLHIEGYTTPPAAFINMIYTQNYSLVLSKFKVKEIQTTNTYFSLLNFEGGYNGIQTTHYTEYNDIHKVLITSAMGFRYIK
jgi:hypothetical protein